MDRDAGTDDSLPSHVAQGVEAVVEVHAEHERRATPYDRAVDRITEGLGTPIVAGLLALIAAVWIGANVVLPADARFDPPPFGRLSTAASVAALLMTALILTTQRRADRLGNRRETLILQLSIQNENKNSKIIEMLQDLRRDHPEIADHVDDEATNMTLPTHPARILKELDHTD